MKKQLLFLKITFLLLIITTSGCTQQESETLKINHEKIIGEWIENIPGTPLIVAMSFITNMSYYESINNTRIWGTYTMTETTITLENGGVSNTFEYTFSMNWTALTLVKIGNTDIRLELTRQPQR
jgi:hypothetical protein